MGRPAALRIADTFVGMASRAPNNQARAEILRRGAVTFAGLASDPKVMKNQRAKDFLTRMGFEFAGAAADAQTQAFQQQPTTSDFTQLLRDTAEAWDQLGPEAAAMTDASLNAAAIQPPVANANNPGINPGVSIAPASFGGANVTLGRSVTVTYNPTPDQIANGIQQSQTVAFWQGTRQESQAMSIDIGTVLQPVPPEHFGVGPDARLFATIQYGADGNTQNSATVDLGLGRRIIVVGNYISVIVGMDPPRTDIVETAGVVTVGASIGTFAAPSRAPVTRTIYVDGLTTATPSGFLQIPVRAVRLYVPPISGAFFGAYTGTLRISFYNLSGHGISTWLYDYATGAGLQDIIVPCDAFFFNISVSGSNADAIRFPFELSL
jgi:hypothetical protein